MARNDTALYEYDGLCTRLQEVRKAVTEDQAWLHQAAGEYAVLEERTRTTKVAFEEARAALQTVGARDITSMRDWERAADIADAAEDTWAMHQGKLLQADGIIRGKKRHLEAMIALVSDLELRLEKFCTVLEFRRTS